MIKLDIYDEQGNEIVKTCEVRRILFGKTCDLLNALEQNGALSLLKDQSSEADDFSLFMKILPAIAPSLSSIFSCDEEEINRTIPYELFNAFAQVMASAFSDINKLNSNSKKQKRI